MATYTLRGGSFGKKCITAVQNIPLAAHTASLQEVTLKTKEKLDAPKLRLTAPSLGKHLPNRLHGMVWSGIGSPMQIRFAHTDVTRVPDFTPYRKQSTLDPTQKAEITDADRKMFSYAIVFSGAVMATYAAKTVVQQFVSNLAPNAKTLAEASIEVGLGAIPEGKNAVFKWRNKPLFVRHRTQEEIDRERAVDVSELRDPMKDEARVQKDEWLILVGICTHLGCVPIAMAGDFGGYYCPCHGSHYDASGRIRKGPAPANLEIPEYRFLDDDTLIVG